jgi:hypothetical protein
MFRHVVMFRWSAEASDAQVAAVAQGLSTLPAAIPEIQVYRHGPDAGINEGNFDYVVVADFATVDDYVMYRDHPTHQSVIVERIRPIVGERSAVQYEVRE